MVVARGAVIYIKGFRVFIHFDGVSRKPSATFCKEKGNRQKIFFFIQKKGLLGFIGIPILNNEESIGFKWKLSGNK